MAMRGATVAFFLDVRDLAARRDLAIAAHDTAARERCEAEKPNQTHHSSERRQRRPEQSGNSWSKQCTVVVAIGARCGHELRVDSLAETRERDRHAIPSGSRYPLV
jgi:hypothetical protein